VTLTLPGDRSLTAPLSGSVTVPAPVFEVFINAYTSYDKYAGTNGNAKNVSAANSVPDAATMYDISGGARIAVSLLDNTNYGEKDFKFTMYHYDTKVTDNLSSLKAASGFGVNVAKIGNISGLTWAQHDLTVSMTFDGVTVTKTNQHHITGLPYYVDCSDVSSISGWTSNNTGKSYGKLCFQEGDGYLHSNSNLFYLPTSVNVTVSPLCTVLATPPKVIVKVDVLCPPTDATSPTKVAVAVTSSAPLEAVNDVIEGFE
jgi:hypothetical protein